MDADKLKKLNELFIQIETVNELGFSEVYINGNGCSAFEVSNCIHAVYEILGLKKPEVTNDMLCEYLVEVGEDPEDYDL
jgi:hypothetical protein